VDGLPSFETTTVLPVTVLAVIPTLAEVATLLEGGQDAMPWKDSFHRVRQRLADFAGSTSEE
jgi:putative hemolysin